MTYLFHQFCGVCCSVWEFSHTIEAKSLQQATEHILQVAVDDWKERQAEEAADPEHNLHSYDGDLPVETMLAGYLRTEVAYYVLDALVPPCDQCGAPIAGHKTGSQEPHAPGEYYWLNATRDHTPDILTRALDRALAQC